MGVSATMRGTGRALASFAARLGEQLGFACNAWDGGRGSRACPPGSPLACDPRAARRDERHVRGILHSGAMRRRVPRKAPFREILA